jgi:hypothetical protein
MVLVHRVVVIYRHHRHDADRSLCGSAYRRVVPNPAGTTIDGSTTTTNTADATEAPTFQALFTQSTYPERHKRHCRRHLAVGGAKFHAEPDGVRYHLRTLWGTISNEFGRQSLSVFICLYGRTSPIVQSVGGVC